MRDLTPQGEEKLEDFMLSNYIALLSELARELGEDDIAKIPENERANTVRRILSDRHALIIIDNLRPSPRPNANGSFNSESVCLPYRAKPL